LFKKETPAKILGLAFSYFIVAAFLFVFFRYLVPLLIGDTEALATKMVALIGQAAELITSLINNFNISLPEGTDLVTILTEYQTMLTAALTTALERVAMAVYDVIIGLILSGAILYYREHLAGTFRRFSIAVFPVRANLFFHRLISYADHTFGKYLVGKIVEALIIGSIYLIVLPLIGMPYAYLVAVIMVITNFIPIVGAYIGGIPCGILILTENPGMVIWFIVICLGIEQIDGNIVYPRVIGSILGLRPVWVMVSVVVLGGMFGIWGMFLSAPIFSITHMLVRDFANARLAKKGRPIPTDEYAEMFASQAPPRRHSLRAAWAAKHPKKPKKGQDNAEGGSEG
jgi:predicted PurR-regulated permease PerM